MYDDTRALHQRVFGTTATILGVLCRAMHCLITGRRLIFNTLGLPARRDEYFTFPFKSKSSSFRFGWTESGNGLYVGLLFSRGQPVG
jgi:hypothetical protein